MDNVFGLLYHSLNSKKLHENAEQFASCVDAELPRDQGCKPRRAAAQFKVTVTPLRNETTSYLLLNLRIVSL